MENSDNKKEAPPRKQGETLKDKIRRHLNDKNDVITDEDIRDTLAVKPAVKNDKETKRTNE